MNFEKVYWQKRHSLVLASKCCVFTYHLLKNYKKAQRFFKKIIFAFIKNYFCLYYLLLTFNYIM